MKRFAVYYAKRPNFFGLSHAGYTKVKEIEAENLNQVFDMMQGENWSPNGEARDLIRSLGLKHTSMSVGDIAVNMGDGTAWMCAVIGWSELDPGAVEILAGKEE